MFLSVACVAIICDLARAGASSALPLETPHRPQNVAERQANLNLEENEAAEYTASDGLIWRRWHGPARECDVAQCTWERTFGGASDDKVSAIARFADDGFVVVGNTRVGRTGPYNAWVLRVADNGALVWHRRFGGRATDQLRDVVTTADKAIFVVGHTASRGAGGSDVWVARFAADGTMTWSRTLGMAGHDEGFDLVALADGGAAVTGHFWTDEARGYDLAVARLAANGDLLWQRSVDRATFETGTALASTVDGDLIVAGTTGIDGLRNTDLWVVRLTDDGKTVWDRTYGGLRGEEPWEVTALPSGDIVVAVETFSMGAGGGDIWLLRLAHDGAVVWERLFGGVNWEHPSALIETEDGMLLLGGHTASKGEGFEDGWLLKLTADGRL